MAHAKDTLMDERDRWLIERIRAAEPDGPQERETWDILSRRHGIQPSDEARKEAIARATRALAAARAEMTLGQYLRQLRATARLPRETLSREARLRPEVIAHLESDDWPVLQVQPARLAKLAVMLGAAKRLLLDLVRTAPTSMQGPIIQPSLRREDKYAAPAEDSEHRWQEDTERDAQLETYLAALSTAFDEELRKSRPGEAP